MKTAILSTVLACTIATCTIKAQNSDLYFKKLSFNGTESSGSSNQIFITDYALLPDGSIFTFINQKENKNQYGFCILNQDGSVRKSVIFSNINSILRIASINPSTGTDIPLIVGTNDNTEKKGKFLLLDKNGNTKFMRSYYTAPINQNVDTANRHVNNIIRLSNGHFLIDMRVHDSESRGLIETDSNGIGLKLHSFTKYGLRPTYNIHQSKDSSIFSIRYAEDNSTGSIYFEKLNKQGKFLFGKMYTLIDSAQNKLITEPVALQYDGFKFLDNGNIAINFNAGFYDKSKGTVTSRRGAIMVVDSAGNPIKHYLTNYQTKDNELNNEYSEYYIVGEHDKKMVFIGYDYRNHLENQNTGSYIIDSSSCKIGIISEDGIISSCYSTLDKGKDSIFDFDHNYFKYNEQNKTIYYLGQRSYDKNSHEKGIFIATLPLKQAESQICSGNRVSSINLSTDWTISTINVSSPYQDIDIGTELLSIPISNPFFIQDNIVCNNTLETATLLNKDNAPQCYAYIQNKIAYIEAKGIETRGGYVYNIMGQTVCVIPPFVQNTTVSLSNQPSGIYIIRVNTDNGSLQQKVIVN